MTEYTQPEGNAVSQQPSVSAGDTRVNIRPGVSILSVLRHLNYKPWFALAEFVDNALQSFVDCRGQLKRLHGADVGLVVEIAMDLADDGRIVIRDNAAGIHRSDYARAFRPAEIPPDRTGLCEFGMGMKSAACWFAREWTVRTKALGETVERTVSFDIETIVNDRIEELDVTSSPAAKDHHYTEITLVGLHNRPQTRTIGKMREHLASIYREFLRHGVLELRFNGEALSYEDPEVMRAPHYRDEDGPTKRWWKRIDIDLGSGLRAQGFAAIRKRASTSGAGFALLRRGRLIEGSGDESYRPETIFGKPNSYRYQRVFGELNLQGFSISHTKDGFRWEEHEEGFLQALREQLDAEPLPLLRQAEEHRVRPRPGESLSAAEEAIGRTAEVIENQVPSVLSPQLGAQPDDQRPPTELPRTRFASRRDIPAELNGCRWVIQLELTDDPAVGDWLTVSDRPASEPRPGQPRILALRVSLAHPFMVRFAGADGSEIEPLLRLAAAIGLAETAARDSGVRMAGTIRRNINDLLRNALSHP